MYFAPACIFHGSYNDIYDFYPKASRLLVNNMCMLMAVGFVMIARLDYAKCVKQFAIAVAGTILTIAVPWLLKTVKSFRKMGWIYCGAGLALLNGGSLGNKIYGANLVLTLGPVYCYSRLSSLRYYMLCLLHLCLIRQQLSDRQL